MLQGENKNVSFSANHEMRRTKMKTFHQNHIKPGACIDCPCPSLVPVFVLQTNVHCYVFSPRLLFTCESVNRTFTSAAFKIEISSETTWQNRLNGLGAGAFPWIIHGLPVTDMTAASSGITQFISNCSAGA